MIKNIFIFLIVLVSVFSCSLDKDKKESDNDRKYKIDGKITNPPTSKVFIQKIVAQAWSNIDSSEIKKDGEFQFKLKVTEPDYYRLDFGNNSAIMIILDGEGMQL